MLIWRAGAAPPPGGGNATSVSAAIRFQFVTSLGWAAAEATCTPTVAIGASAPSTTIEVSAAAETNRLRVFIASPLSLAVLDPVVRTKGSPAQGNEVHSIFVVSSGLPADHVASTRCSYGRAVVSPSCAHPNLIRQPS